MGDAAASRLEGPRAGCPVCGRELGGVGQGEPVERFLITTASGSCYAVWHRGQVWWIRPRAVATPAARRRPDTWVPTARPRPWPCGPGHRVSLLLSASGYRGGELVGQPTDWRTTTPVVTVETWDPGDPWPGEPPTR